MIYIIFYQKPKKKKRICDACGKAKKKKTQGTKRQHDVQNRVISQ